MNTNPRRPLSHLSNSMHNALSPEGTERKHYSKRGVTRKSMGPGALPRFSVGGGMTTTTKKKNKK